MSVSPPTALDPLPQVRIAVDCMGGDHGPGDVLPACRAFLASHPLADLRLVGTAEALAPRRRAAAPQPARAAQQSRKGVSSGGFTTGGAAFFFCFFRAGAGAASLRAARSPHNACSAAPLTPLPSLHPLTHPQAPPWLLMWPRPCRPCPLRPSRMPSC